MANEKNTQKVDNEWDDVQRGESGEQGKVEFEEGKPRVLTLTEAKLWQAEDKLAVTYGATEDGTPVFFHERAMLKKLREMRPGTVVEITLTGEKPSKRGQPTQMFNIRQRKNTGKGATFFESLKEQHKAIQSGTEEVPF